MSAAYLLLEKRGVTRRVPHRGAFICPAGAAENPIDWSSKISRQAHLLDEPVLEMLAQSRLPDLRYRLSAGTPALSCFPLAPFRKAINKVLTTDALPAMAIAPTEGQPRLRRAIAAREGGEASHILIVAGAQEASTCWRGAWWNQETASLSTVQPFPELSRRCRPRGRSWWNGIRRSGPRRCWRDC